MRNRQTNFVVKVMPILLAALVLSGCAIGPNYHRPAVQTPTGLPRPRPIATDREAQSASVRRSAMVAGLPRSSACRNSSGPH